MESKHDAEDTSNEPVPLHNVAPDSKKESLNQKNFHKSSLARPQFELMIGIKEPTMPFMFVKDNAIWEVPLVWLTNTKGCWLLKLLHNSYDRSRRTKFGSGWAEYKRANSLVIGDICVFKLLSRRKEDVTFLVTKKKKLRKHATISEKEVTIDVEDPNMPNEQVLHYNVPPEPMRGSITEKDFQKTTLAIPLFELTIRVSEPSMPVKFVKDNAIWGISPVRLTNSKGCWLVKLYHHSDDHSRRSTRFGSGWEKFKRDNNLVIGDICVFKLLSKRKEDVVFLVAKKKLR